MNKGFIYAVVFMCASVFYWNTEASFPTDPTELVINGGFGNYAYDVWPVPERFNLTYCVSDKFGRYKESVVEAMLEATESWMEAANIEFRYVPEEDENCHLSTRQVVFGVGPVSNADYAAKAFFPSSPSRSRNIVISAKSLDYPQTVLDGVLRHEVGHVLGFRHEHIRSENEFAGCEEQGPFKPLTQYDKYSVMHYPQCGGLNSFENLVLTDFDIAGAQMMYPTQLASTQ